MFNQIIRVIVKPQHEFLMLSLVRLATAFSWLTPLFDLMQTKRLISRECDQPGAASDSRNSPAPSNFGVRMPGTLLYGGSEEHFPRSVARSRHRAVGARL